MTPAPSIVGLWLDGDACAVAAREGWDLTPAEVDRLYGAAREAGLGAWVLSTCYRVELFLSGRRSVAVLLVWGRSQLSAIRPDESLIGGKGVFMAETEAALLAGQIDLAVHSLKGLPTDAPEGLTPRAITEHEDPPDARVCPAGHTLDALPADAMVGTSRLRRGTRVVRQRPDLTIRSIRGSVETRIRKTEGGAYDAPILAVAGLSRRRAQRAHRRAGGVLSVRLHLRRRVGSVDGARSVEGEVDREAGPEAARAWLGRRAPRRPRNPHRHQARRGDLLITYYTLDAARWLAEGDA